MVPIIRRNTNQIAISIIRSVILESGSHQEEESTTYPKTKLPNNIRILLRISQRISDRYILDLHKIEGIIIVGNKDPKKIRRNRL